LFRGRIQNGFVREENRMPFDRFVFPRNRNRINPKTVRPFEDVLARTSKNRRGTRERRLGRKVSAAVVRLGERADGRTGGRAVAESARIT